MDYTLIIIGIILGVSEYIKSFLPITIKNVTLDKKLLPIFNMAMAFLFTYLFVDVQGKEYFLQSVVVGLSASGLYSGYKNVRQFTTTNTNDGNILG